jgi:hypothetical protein
MVTPGSGLFVEEHRLNAQQQLEKRDFHHKILLGGVYGDSPGIKKVAKWLSHSAYLGCGYCLLRGKHSSGMYFQGYHAPTCYGPLGPREVKDGLVHVPARTSEDAEGSSQEQPATGYGKLGFCGDPDTHLTHGEHVARAVHVDRAVVERAAAGVDKDLNKRVGSHGVSPIIKALDYVDYNNVFLVPIAHAGLCGAVKDFWYHVLSTPPRGQQRQWYQLLPEARKIMQQRASHLVPTCDFGRKYTDIISRKGNWTMEDWLHWTEAWSVYILRGNGAQPLLEPRLAEMWEQLRKGLLYFCRVNPLDDIAQDREQAQAALKSYGALVEQHFPLSMCKFNLHLLVCRLYAQEGARGKVAYGTEYWVENLIQLAKSNVRYRTSKYPELVLVHDMLIDEALARARAKWSLGPPELALKSLSEWVPQEEGRAGLDEGDEEGNQLLGSGRELKSQQLQQAHAAVGKLFRHGLAPAGWYDHMVAGATFRLYTYADLKGSELVHSTAYLRSRTRVSYHVYAEYFEGGGTEATRYMAKVLYFLKVISASCPHPLRIAVSDLFKVACDDSSVGSMWHTRHYDRPTHSAYPVRLCDMRSKHAMGTTHLGAAEAWFFGYSNMSGTGREPEEEGA